ncbi:DUF1129 family protein [Lactobacillus sp. ESL0684]|uniref:DUF1129 family protein n=1 Tax=Lactobacillus sp. ESL0684 TaxID=2983213 RepID=UPI0023F8F48F|nr:DUF1129 family protein [Lactobacillus sp. ESL0684]WEV43432.1 DUF1129 family protein [Lactobacillus sp. ESL0684]
MAEKETQQTKIDVNKQEKLKEQVTTQNRDDELQQAEPAELRKQLSNKNSDYVFRLQKELEEQGKLGSADASKRVDDLLADLVVAQHHGKPASTFYGMSPKIKAADMLKPKKKTAADIPFWQYAVDSALLYIAIFVGLFGVIALFTTNQKENSQMGILTLVSVGAAMGVFMTKYNDWVMPAGKQQKIPWGKLILGFAGLLLGLFVWIWLVSLPVLQPINPVLPAMGNIIIAVLAYGIRWFFRRHFQIVGSVFTPKSKDK